MDKDQQLALASAALPPYARALGLSVRAIEHGAPLIEMPSNKIVLGRPGFFHGGALGGLLEIAGVEALRLDIALRGGGWKFKQINISVEFLRGAVAGRPTVARGEVTRAGRRVANVSVRAWQDDPEKPVSEAWMNFLLSPDPAQ